MRSLCSTASRCTLATCLNSRGERGQLEVVRREQRVAAALLDEVARDRPREREAVVGRGAAADLVHEHEALRRRVVQDVGGFGHLDHEGRAPAGEIVGRADAREDLVDRAEARALRRHVRAAVREQRDQRDLPHVGRFAAHVRAGDEQHLPRGREPRVVRDERVDLRFDDRVAAARRSRSAARRRTRARSSRARPRARRTPRAHRARRAQRAMRCSAGTCGASSSSSSS